MLWHGLSRVHPDKTKKKLVAISTEAKKCCLQLQEIYATLDNSIKIFQFQKKINVHS